MSSCDAPEEGMLVELHALSRADLNGEQGLCGAWDKTKERFAVALAAGAIAVKPSNLRRAPPVSAAAAAEATEMVHEAAALLAQARGGTNHSNESGPPRLSKEAPSLIAEAEDMLAQAARVDAACTVLHLTWCDLANMRSDYAAAVLHARRAVANQPETKALRQHAHMALANAYGNTGDMPGEVAQLKLVLRIEPENLHARLSLGQALIAQGRDEDAVPELMMAMQLRSEDGPHSGEHAEALRRMAAHKLKCIFMQQVQRYHESEQNEETLALLVKVTALHDRFAEAKDDSALQNIDANAEFVHAGNFETYRAIAHLRLGHLTEAEQAATCAVELTEGIGRMVTPIVLGGLQLTEGVIRPFALCTLGSVKERMADEAGQDLALYAEAQKLYLAAHHAGSNDRATAECYTRVQAKISPDIEFTLSPARIGHDLCLSGQAKCLNPWSPEPLPPRQG